MGYLAGAAVLCVVASVVGGVAYASAEKREPTVRAPSQQVQSLLAGRMNLQTLQMNMNHLTAKEKACFFDYDPVLFQNYAESAGSV